MINIKQICDFLEQFAPKELAEDWDNVGLLVGESNADISNIMTCLTVTPESAAEAIENQVDLLVAHHPMPFSSIKRITDETTVGRLLLELIRANVAIYSPHTAFDSAKSGINQQLTEKFNLLDSYPLTDIAPDDPSVGTGRVATLPESVTLGELVTRAKAIFGLEQLRYVGDAESRVSKIGFACGAGGSFLSQAAACGCDVLVTGETNFHTCLEAKALGVGLVLLGHFFSERFAVESLAETLQARFSDIKVWASRNECDPLNWG